MTRSTFCAILITMLALPAWAEDTQAPHSLAELSKGEAGRLMLVARTDDGQRETRLDSIGLRGEYRDGRLLWIDRRQDGGTVVGMGYKLKF